MIRPWLSLRSGLLVLAVATTSLVASSLAPTGAHAQDQAARDAAREQFTRGVEFYEGARYQEALAAFQEAYRLAPHPTMRVNMANCYEHLDRPLEALHHFERFLAEAQDATRQQRREVTDAIARLSQRLGEVRLSVAPDGATVVIDNAETRRAPVLEPVRLTAGVHHVTVRMDGYRTENRELTVNGGDSQRVNISLQRGDAGEPPVAAATSDETTDDAVVASTDEGTDDVVVDEGATGEPVEEPLVDQGGGGGGFEFRLTAPVIVAGSATIAFGLTAIATGSVALVANSDFESAVERVRTTTGREQTEARLDGRAAADLANTMSIVTDVFVIATVAAAGATLFFILLEGFNGSGDAETADAQAPRLAVTPFASPSVGGMQLLLDF